jgi:HAE1 family hydrophobic/amphiphilic exporter-1
LSGVETTQVEAENREGFGYAQPPGRDKIMLGSLTIVFIFGIITILLAKQILNLAIHNKIGFTMLLVFFMLIGFLFMQKLKVELRPDISYQTVSIYIAVRGGMSVVDIERLIIKPVEESMIQVSKVKNIISRSKPNEATISLEFDSDTNMDMASLEVREYFMRVKNKLPKEIEKPVIARYNENDSYVMNISFTSNRKTTEQLRYIVEKSVKDKIMRIEGVANVLVSGGRERKFLIDLDEKKLIAHNISINDVLQIIGTNNINILTGKLDDKTKFYALRVDGNFLSLNDIKNLSIKLDDKTGIVKLSEVADIKDSYLEAESYARLNEQEAVSIYVYKESSANTMEITQKVETVLNKLVLENFLDKDIKLTYLLNQGKIISNSINSIKVTIFYGIVLVILILAIVFSSHFFAKLLSFSAFVLYFIAIFGVYYFGLSQNFVLIFIVGIILFFTFFSFIYKDYRPSIFIAITIPISLLITLILMYIGKISLNVMSMSGLLLGVGLLVDNSIVVVESYITHRNNPELKNLSNEEIIKISTQKMIEPIIGSTLTTVIVFLSFFFLDQKTQMLYKDIAFTVSSALFASFFCSIGVIPMLLCFYDTTKTNRREDNIDNINIIHKIHDFFTKEVLTANKFMEKFTNFIKIHRIIIVDILAIIAVVLFFTFMFLKKYSLDKT